MERIPEPVFDSGRAVWKPYDSEPSEGNANASFLSLEAVGCREASTKLGTHTVTVLTIRQSLCRAQGVTECVFAGEVGPEQERLHGQVSVHLGFEVCLNIFS